MLERQDRRQFLKNAARLGGGLVLYPVSGYGQEREPLYDIPTPPEHGFIKFRDYNYMDKHNWALCAFAKDALEGRIYFRQNRLFHIDTHHDVCYPPSIRISKNFVNLFRRPTSYGEMLDAAIQETKITNVGSWIIKAFIADLTDEVYWVRPRWDFRDKGETSVIFFAFEQLPPDKYPDDKYYFYRAFRTREKSEIEGSKKFLTVHEIFADEILQHVERSESFLFDTDFDYFSCSGYGEPEWVKMEDIEKSQKGLVEWYKNKYDEGLEIKGDVMRNPTRPVYRASLSEIKREISVIKDIDNALPKDRPSSKTVAVSSDFLFPNQKKYIIDNFFS